MLPYPIPVSVIGEWFKEVWSCFTEMYKWTYLCVLYEKTLMYVAGINAENSLTAEKLDMFVNISW